MIIYSLSHLSDPVLLCALVALVAQDCVTTAMLLAHLAEVDARRLYLPAAHPSMFSYCVHELRLSKDAAFKRIRAARVARQFPAIFAALAEGRLQLSGVVLLAPHLTPENAGELLAAAAHRSKAEIEALLAARFPRPELPTRVELISAPTAPTELLTQEPVIEQAPGPVRELQLAPGRVAAVVERPKVTPLSPGRFALQVTIGQGTHDLLRYAQALLGHALPAGEIAEVLDRALRALVGQLEKHKFAATSRPRTGPRRTSAGRHIPAEVKRTVWERDGGRCTFVSDTGQRCPARTRLEYDHADPVARGGEATVENARLRCRAHNEYAAECTFGTGFMEQKRHEAQRTRASTAAAGREPDVVPWLRRLGFRAEEARRAAERCASLSAATLEERVRFALSLLTPPHRRVACGAGTAS